MGINLRLNKAQLEAWDLIEDDTWLYLLTREVEAGTSIFVEKVDTTNYTVRVFLNKSEVLKYKEIADDESAAPAKVRYKTLVNSMENTSKKYNYVIIDCALCVFGVDDKIYNLDILWTNLNN